MQNRTDLPDTLIGSDDCGILVSIARAQNVKTTMVYTPCAEPRRFAKSVAFFYTSHKAVLSESAEIIQTSRSA